MRGGHYLVIIILFLLLVSSSPLGARHSIDISAPNDHATLSSPLTNTKQSSEGHYKSYALYDVQPPFNYPYNFNYSYNTSDFYKVQQIRNPGNNNEINYLFQPLTFDNEVNLTSITLHRIRFNTFTLSRTFEIIVVRDYNQPWNYLYKGTYTMINSSGEYHNITFHMNLTISGTVYVAFYNPVPYDNIAYYIYMFNNSHSTLRWITADINAHQITYYNYLYNKSLYISVETTQIGYQPSYSYYYPINQTLYEIADEVFLDTIEVQYDHSYLHSPSYITLITPSHNQTYTFNQTTQTTLSIRQQILAIRVDIFANCTNANAFHRIVMNFWYNNKPIITLSRHNLTISRHEPLNIYNYINATDPEDDIEFEFNPPLSQIDTSVPQSITLSISVHDKVKYPLYANTTMNITIVNHSPSLTNLTIIFEINHSENVNIVFSPENYQQVLGLPYNASITNYTVIPNYYDADNDKPRFPQKPLPISLPLNNSTAIPFRFWLNDTYANTSYDFILIINIPHLYERHYTQIVVQTQIKEKPIYINQTIIKEHDHYIYINRTNNCTNQSSNITLTEQEKSDLRNKAYHDYYSEAERSYIIVILILAIILILTITYFIDKVLRHIYPSSQRLIGHNNDDDKDDFEEDFSDDDTPPLVHPSDIIPPSKSPSKSSESEPEIIDIEEQ